MNTTPFLTFLQMLKCLLINLKNRTSLPTTVSQKNDVLTISNKDAAPEQIPMTIWMYWEDQELPVSVAAMVSRIESLHHEHEIHVLNKDTLVNFLPDLQFTGEMPIANKTDLIRLELLYRYGGIWLDCTTILGESLLWVHQVVQTRHFDIVGYFRERSTLDCRYPVVESWLLAASPKNDLIAKWLEVLKPLKDMGSEAYFNAMKNRQDYDIIKQDITTPSYLLVYLAGQIALRDTNGFNLYLKKCEDNALYLQEYYGWSNYKMNYVLCRLPTLLGRMPIIKLTSGDRMFVEMLRKFGLVHRNSTIGELLYNREKQSS